MYQYEKKQTYFWYNMRTIFSPDFGADDLLGDEIQGKINEIVSNLNDFKSGRVGAQKCLCIPDFVGIMDPAMQQCYLRSRFFEMDLHDKKCQCCYLPKFHVRDVYDENMDEYEKEIEDWFDQDKRLAEKIHKKDVQRKWCKCFESADRETRIEQNNKYMGSSLTLKDSMKSSTFGFILADSVWGARVLSFELYRHFNKASQFLQPVIGWFEDLKQKSDERKTQDLEIQTEKQSRHDEAFDDSAPNGLGYRPDANFENLYAPTEAESKKETLIPEENPPKTEAEIALENKIGSVNYYIGKWLKLTSDYYPFEPDDILWHNLGVKTKERCWVRTIYFLVIMSMFIFLTTPVACLNAIKSVPGVVDALNFNWLSSDAMVATFFKNYMLQLLTLLTNSFFLMITGIIAAGKHFPTKFKYHRYLMQVSFYFFLINMVIMPGIGQFGVTSVANIFVKTEDRTFGEVVETFFLKDGGNTFLMLIIAKIGVGFLMDCLRYRDLLIHGRLNSLVALKIRENFNVNKWCGDEYDLMPMGPKLAMHCTMVTMVAIFAGQSPLIAVAVGVWILVSTAVEGMVVIQFHKRECEKFGALFAHALWNIFNGIIFAQVVFLSLSIGIFYFAKKNSAQDSVWHDR